MADRTAANPYGVDYTMPSRFPQMQEPYNVPTETPTQPQQQPGLFDSHPFHEYLKDNVDKPWQLSDEDIKKHFEDYMGDKGPIKAILAHDEALHNRRGSGATIEDHVKNELAYHKLMTQKEIQSSMPKLKAYLQSLKPQGAAAEQPTSDDNFANSLQRAGLDIERGAAIPAGNVLSALSPLVGNKATLGSPLAFLSAFQSPEHAQATAESMFKAADAAKEQADKLPHDPSVKGRLVEGLTDFAASLPTGAAQYVSNAYQDAVKEGKPQFNAWVDALKQAGTIAMGLGVGRVASAFKNPLTRRAAGAAGGAAIPATSNVLSGQPIDPVQAAIGGAAGALSASPRSEVNVKAKEGGTSEAATGAEPTQAPVQGGPPANESGTAGVVATELSPKSQTILKNIAEELQNTPDPIKARALYDSMLPNIPESERPLAKSIFSDVWAQVHGTDVSELGFEAKAPVEAGTPEEQALAAKVSPQESPQTTSVAETKQPVAPIESRQTPLSKPKVVDASQFTLEHLDDARKYHATQDITEKGKIIKKLMNESGLPKNDVKAFIEAVKGAKGPKVKPR